MLKLNQNYEEILTWYSNNMIKNTSFCHNLKNPVQCINVNFLCQLFFFKEMLRGWASSYGWRNKRCWKRWRLPGFCLCKNFCIFSYHLLYAHFVWNEHRLVMIFSKPYIAKLVQLFSLQLIPKLRTFIIFPN